MAVLGEPQCVGGDRADGSNFLNPPFQDLPQSKIFFSLKKKNILYYVNMAKKEQLHIIGKTWMVLGSILPPRIWPCLCVQQNEVYFTKDSNSTIPVKHGMGSVVRSGHQQISSETKHVSKAWHLSASAGGPGVSGHLNSWFLGSISGHK